MARIGFIGAGIVATALAVRLSERGYEILAVSSRSRASAEKLARRISNCRVAESNQEVASLTNLVFIVTSDGAIASVVDSVQWQQGQSVIHCNGAASTDLLERARSAGRRSQNLTIILALPTFFLPAAPQRLVAPLRPGLRSRRPPPLPPPRSIPVHTPLLPNPRPFPNAPRGRRKKPNLTAMISPAPALPTIAIRFRAEFPRNVGESSDYGMCATRESSHAHARVCPGAMAGGGAGGHAHCVRRRYARAMAPRPKALQEHSAMVPGSRPRAMVPEAEPLQAQGGGREPSSQGRRFARAQAGALGRNGAGRRGWGNGQEQITTPCIA